MIGWMVKFVNCFIEKMKGSKYDVAYWKENETYDDATDFDMSIFELACSRPSFG